MTETECADNSMVKLLPALICELLIETISGVEKLFDDLIEPDVIISICAPDATATPVTSTLALRDDF